MQKILASKTLTVVGASGYVGQNFCKQAAALGFKVNGISRRGFPPGQPQEWHKSINWVRGDAMEVESIKGVLEDSDLIVHTVGTLIDTSFTKLRSPGQTGTYEQMNRDTLINVVKAVEDSKRKPTVVYVSASRSPPFIHRYLTTKQEAENYLQEKHQEGKINAVILKPGFIYSWSERWWSVPVKLEIDIYRKVYSTLNCLIPKNTFLNRIWSELEVDSSVKLYDLIDSGLYAGVESSLQGKSFDNNEMAELAETFRAKVRQ